MVFLFPTRHQVATVLETLATGPGKVATDREMYIVQEMPVMDLEMAAMDQEMVDMDLEIIARVVTALVDILVATVQGAKIIKNERIIRLPVQSGGLTNF